MLEFVDPWYYLFLALAVAVVLGARAPRHRVLALLIASWTFFVFLGGAALLLLLATTLTDYVLGRAIARSDDPRRRRALLTVGIVSSLLLLVTAKYTVFLLGNIEVIARVLGHPIQTPLGFVIPALAISFYTFESISYLVDVHQRRTPPCESFVEYAAFIAFFPHLVAGPIVRAREFLPQLRERIGFRSENLVLGTTYILYGLVEKLVIADTAGAAADRIFWQSSFVDVPPGAAFLGILAFGVQIYADFAAYTHIAIGSAKLFNLDLPINFNFPYLATSPRDFWRRWHISLSTWLRDYLYAPLGGSRNGRWRMYGALMLTMLLGGLWHGASWTFVLWGAFHGALLVGQRALEPLSGAFQWVWKPARVVAAWLVTQYLVFFGWLLFRAENLEQVAVLAPKWLLLHGLPLSLDGLHVPLNQPGFLVALLCAFALVGLAARMGGGLVERLARAKPLPWGVGAGLVFALLAFASGTSPPFIYFQF